MLPSPADSFSASWILLFLCPFNTILRDCALMTQHLEDQQKLLASFLCLRHQPSSHMLSQAAVAALDGLLCPKGVVRPRKKNAGTWLSQFRLLSQPCPGQARRCFRKSRDWTCTERRKGCPGQRNRSRGLKVLWIHVHETGVYSAGPELQIKKPGRTGGRGASP